MKDVPSRNEAPEPTLLRFNDGAKAETAGRNENSDQRQTERNLIAHHLRTGPKSAQEGILTVRGPARQCHSIHAHRSHAQNNKEANIQIRDLQWDVQTKDIDPVANGNDCNGS